MPCQHKRDKPSLATSIGATGGVVSNSISTSLLAFIVGYAAILAVPGPNMLALGGLAALRGFRAAVPMSLGIAGGATTLAAIIDVTSATAARLPWRTVAEFAGAGLLLLVACLVMRLRPNAPAERCLRAPIVEFGAGFCTALTNPITAGYFVAEFGGYLRGSLELTAVALAAIPVVALAACLSFSRFLMTPPMRRITEAWHRPIRLGTATVLVAMAGAMILCGV